MVEIRWERYPSITQFGSAREWLESQAIHGRAPNTVSAYGRDLDDYLAFCSTLGIDPHYATKGNISSYLNELLQRPSPRGTHGELLANATLQRRLTAVRLYYDFLMEEGVRSSNPVGRGRYTPRQSGPSQGQHALLPRYHKLPWIPTEEQWIAILHEVRAEPLRNRVMFALAYDGGLRREELCRLQLNDIDPAHRQIHIRAETTKSREDRIVCYQEATGKLYVHYVHYRRTLSETDGPLFLSESCRNRLAPITIWTWSKVVHHIAQRAGVTAFTPHSLRHLCLTDLARAGWDLHEIALFAGHRSTATTQLYIHLSGRDQERKLAQGMHSIHAWRARMMAEVLQ